MSLTSNAAYMAQNAQGFEGDYHLKNKIEKIITDNKIKWVVETGTFMGGSTRKFAEMAERVDTIEINNDFYFKAKAMLSDVPNVKQHQGNSPVVLDAILDSLPKKGRKPNCFMWLDAHWNEYNPLLDELAVIAKHKLKPFIAIHDFKVPGRPDLGFDTYGKIVYEWDWIAESIENIYGKDGYQVDYNDQAAGAKRGVIFISPKK